MTLLLRVFDSASATLCHVSSSVLCLRLLQYLQHDVTVSVRKALSQRRTVVYQVTSVAGKTILTFWIIIHDMPKVYPLAKFTTVFYKINFKRKDLPLLWLQVCIWQGQRKTMIHSASSPIDNHHHFLFSHSWSSVHLFPTSEFLSSL